MKKKYKILIATLCAVAFSMLQVWFLGELFTPKYMSGVLEGAMIAEYYDEELPHDVIFVGDCEVYETYSPITLWEEYGITSYIRGSAQQLIWQSYWLLEETFSHETPKVVVYNVQSMVYSEPQSEAYNRMTLDGMKNSSYKFEAVKASMTEDESLLSYFIPLLRYHSRWNELTKEDFTYLFDRAPVTCAGYLMRTDVKPEMRWPTPSAAPEQLLQPICFDYLAKMADLCEKNGARLVLVKAPSLYPHWYDEWDAQIREFADGRGLDYFNFIPLIDEIGIDMQTDTYDGGLHLNLYGAEKLSSYFGSILQERYALNGHLDDVETARVWGEKASAYYALEQAQLAELEKYGYLKSWTLGE